MPKEITHWLVALEMAQTDKEGSFLDTARVYPSALQLGAVFPDLLFYLAGSQKMVRYRELARAYHGAQGEDTHELLRRLAAALPGSPYRGPLTAFLSGVACHIRTDMTFHPLVYFATGNYEEENPALRSLAVIGHRRLECLMDQYFCGGTAGLAVHSLADILDRLELPPAYLAGILFRDETENEDFRAMILQALNNYRLLQRLFRFGPLMAFLERIRPFLSPASKEMAALFYATADEAHLARLDGPLAYQNPVTTEEEKIRIRDLFHRSVARSRELVVRIEADMASGGSILPEKGPSLSYGVCVEKDTRAAAFAEEPFFSSLKKF